MSTCVGLGYGRFRFSLEVFPGSTAFMPSFLSLRTPHQSSFLCKTDLPILRTASLDRHPSDGAHSSLRHSIVLTTRKRDRISNLLYIGFPFRVILSSRLTLGGSTFPRNPWTFGEYDSRILLVTHADILSCIKSTVSCRSDFFSDTTLPYQYACAYSLASVLCLAPGIFGATILDQ